MNTSLILNNKKFNFPTFIKNNNSLLAHPKIEKIFPLIGLPNSKESINVQIKDNQFQIIDIVELLLNKWISKWETIWEDYCCSNRRKTLLHRLATTNLIFRALHQKLKLKINIKVIDNTKIILTNPIKSFDDTVLIKKGTDIVSLISKLLKYNNDYFKEELYTIKNINQELKKNLHIVFSSDNLQGIWDIATMSMRGIQSCMRWESRTKNSLIGSIVDPGCGIIYLTNNTKTKYGSKMLFRALVRLGINTKSNTPVIILDRLYSTYYKTDRNYCSNLDKYIRELFLDFLKKKLPNIQIINAESSASIVLSNDYSLLQHNKFNLLKEDELSYRDIPILYQGIEYECIKDNIINYFNNMNSSTKSTKQTKSIKSSKLLNKLKAKNEIYNLERNII